jgi:hypothetical protein
VPAAQARLHVCLCGWSSQVLTPKDGSRGWLGYVLTAKACGVCARRPSCSSPWRSSSSRPWGSRSTGGTSPSRATRTGAPRLARARADEGPDADRPVRWGRGNGGRGPLFIVCVHGTTGKLIIGVYVVVPALLPVCDTVARIPVTQE